MSGIKRFLISALFAPLLGGGWLHAAEFEVLDKFSVDGYSVLRGSADIIGGGFAVGGSSFVVKGGNVGIGTTSPAVKFQVYDTNTGSSATMRVTTPSGSEVVISTAGNVGIGTTNPAANLDVAGGIKVGNEAVCTADKAGTIRWSGLHFEGCTGTAWRQFDNQPPPTVSSINPASGVITGGTAITISGSGYNLGVEILIGGVAATVTGILGSQITATTPGSAAAGAKEVKITNTDGQNCVSAFTYNPLPTITSVSPSSGLQGTVITIGGTGFASGLGVTIGGLSATGIVRVSDTQITAAAPASSVSGAKNVTVTNPDTGSVVNSSPGFTYKIYATGGTITSVGGYRIHTFTGSDTLTVVTGGNVDYLIVAGGGSGGNRHAGGGGGGGVLTGNTAVTAQGYTITVGAGGSRPFLNTDAVGANGANTTALGFTAVGGGGGGCNGQLGTSGGSGAGHGERTGAVAAAAGTAGQGNNGGIAGSVYGGAGGGGGAGAAGGTGCVPTGVPGNGGAGIQSSISGSAVYYGGGGGGGGYQLSNTSSGGIGGGGAGGNYQTFAPATPGTSNTGGGGGGGTTNGTTTNGAGGEGGSGIVIIRYPN